MPEIRPSTATCGAQFSTVIGRSHMPELDALRGIAILAVLFYHGFSWSCDPVHFARWQRLVVMATLPGWLGVNLFFVLSGFLISGILLDSRHNPHYYRNFYIRRALRILPLYYMVLAILLASGIGSLAYVGLSAIYLANVTWLFGVGVDYGVLWSLAVEEHFYLIWPTVLRWLSPKRTAVMCAAIIAFTPLIRMTSAHFGIPAKGMTWGEIDGLACGAFLAAALRFPTLNRRQFARLACLFVVIGTTILCAGAHFGLMTRKTWVGNALQETPFNLLFAGLLAAILLLGTSRYARFTSSAILRFFGDTSYCLYLIHLLVFTAFDKLSAHFFHLDCRQTFSGLCVRFAFSISCALALACISKRFLEKPFLRYKDKLAPLGVRAPHDLAATAAT